MLRTAAVQCVPMQREMRPRTALLQAAALLAAAVVAAAQVEAVPGAVAASSSDSVTALVVYGDALGAGFDTSSSYGGTVSLRSTFAHNSQYGVQALLGAYGALALGMGAPTAASAQELVLYLNPQGGGPGASDPLQRTSQSLSVVLASRLPAGQLIPVAQACGVATAHVLSGVNRTSSVVANTLTNDPAALANANAASAAAVGVCRQARPPLLRPTPAACGSAPARGPAVVLPRCAAWAPPTAPAGCGSRCGSRCRRGRTSAGAWCC